MIRGLVLAAALALPAGASAAAPQVDLMVVGKTRLLHGPATVAAKTTTAKVGKRRCRVGAATPLAALLRAPLDLAIRDYARCTRRAVDATGLYVAAVEGEREKGAAGWVYKRNNKVLSTGAGDPMSKLRGGDRVLWFWCRTAGACQRTLVVKPAASTATPGGSLAVHVVAYDDNGKGTPAAGATVAVGDALATADASGVATVTVPSQPGRFDVVASKTGLVRSFAAEVQVG